MSLAMDYLALNMVCPCPKCKGCIMLFLTFAAMPYLIGYDNLLLG